MTSPKRPLGGLVLDPSLGHDLPTGPEQVPADVARESAAIRRMMASEDPQTYQILDHLAGMWFYWDEAPPSKKGFYHGRVAASLEGGYYLLEFAPSDKLPDGLHEIVHIALMAEQTWSFYRTEAEYLAALRGADGDS